jgi:hypothetical protein
MATQDFLPIFAQPRTIVLALSLAAMAGCKGSHSTTGATPTPGGANGAGVRPSAAKLDELMSVSKLLAAYKDNAQQADAILKGKRHPRRVGLPFGHGRDGREDGSAASTVSFRGRRPQRSRARSGSGHHGRLHLCGTRDERAHERMRDPPLLDAHLRETPSERRG